MRKKRAVGGKKGLDEWFATYSDMVTLLFCFFVLLYASSTRDDVRLQYILQSVRPDGKFINTIVGPPPEDAENTSIDGNTNVPIQGPPDLEVDGGQPPGSTSERHVFESLAQALAEVVEENDLQDVMSVHSTPGMIRIRLGSDVMFEPDQFALMPTGRRILDLIAPSVKATEEYIGSIQIQGHTADVGATYLGVNDWELSAMRATTVLSYLDRDKNMAASEKFKAEGLGRFHPIASNESESGRSANRRVEIVINRRPDLPREVDRFIRDIMAYDYNQSHREVDAEGTLVQQPGSPVTSVVGGILDELWDRYGDKRQPEYHMPQGGQVGPSPSDFGQLTEDDYREIEEVEGTEDPADSSED
ncbi:MAG: flagellar motor protein MotB [Oscillospiraceae bacterium]|nr:flagellar motor protein MotB [Oscillospiraceae bacterium]